MAAASSQPWPGLAPEQQRLLLAALASNKKRKSSTNVRADSSASVNGTNANPSTNTADTNGIDPSVFSSSSMSDPFAVTSASPSAFNLTNGDAGFDTAFANGFGDFAENFPSFDSNGTDMEQGEKRKNPDDDDEDDEDEDGDEGRRGSEPKGAKKPGRKLLTSEPTTKRKAQNRAAQRAFRERKEKHLKDLETKVSDLEKASESANHENSVLRVQVERLQDELKNYRRRLSLTGTGSNISPTSARTSLDGNRSFSGSSLDFDFNFDFPKFGGMPGSVLPSTQALAKQQQQQQQQQQQPSPQPEQQDSSPFDSYDSVTSNGLSLQNSVSSISNGNNNTQNLNGNSGIGGSIFGAGFFNIMEGTASTSPQPLSNTLNGSMTDIQGRPSPCHTNSSAARSPASNFGQGASSSCCTSPDPVDWTNLTKNKRQTNGTEQSSRTNTNNNNTPGLTNDKTPNSNDFSLDFLANQNGNTFDPVLFGDYRDTQNAIVGDDAFTGGFFEDGLPFPDFNDPFNFNLSADTTNPAPAQGPRSDPFKQMQQPPAQQPKKKPNLMEQVAKRRDGDYEDEHDKDLVMPGADEFTKDAPNLMTCHKIWNQLQNCPRFKSGDFDVDSLCSELSAKAKCTETGVAVPKEAVEAALWKLAGPSSDKQQQGNGNSSGKDAAGAQKEKPDARAEAMRRFEKFMAHN